MCYGHDRCDLPVEVPDRSLPLKRGVQKMKKLINKIKSNYSEMSKSFKVLTLISAALVLYSVLPILTGLRCVGCIPPACIGAFFLFCAFNRERIKNPKTKTGKFLVYAVGTTVVLGSAFLIFLSGVMLNAAFNTPSEEIEAPTVIVLGCQIWGDRPSKMLKDRLDKAAEYLNENPDAMCIVAGGQGEDEEYPEAVVMKNYLVEKGIDQSRIFTEENSTSTDENIKFSCEIIDKENLSKKILIASDRFHQYRSQKIAEKYGLEGYALPCPTVWYLSMQYWFREMAGIVKMTVTGEILI